MEMEQHQALREIAFAPAGQDDLRLEQDKLLVPEAVI